MIEQYRRLMFNIVSSSFLGNRGGERLTPAIDGDNNGRFDMSDFNRFDPDTQAAIRRILGDTNMQTLEAGNAFAMNALIENGFVVERVGAMNESRTERHTPQVDPGSHSGAESIDTGTQILTGNGLARATEFIGRMTETNRNNLATHLIRLGFAESITNTSELAQASARFQQQYSLTVDGMPGNATISKLNEIVQAAQTSPNRQTSVPSGGIESNLGVPRSTITYPPQGGEATIALQQLIGTPADGAFGPNSRRSLQQFLQSAGLYTGAIDGIIGRGSLAAIEAYNRGQSQSVAQQVSEERISRPRGQDAMRTRISRNAQRIIDALAVSISPSVNSRPDFQSLTRNIFEMQRRGQFDANVWNQFIALAQAQGWNDFLAHVNGTRLSDQDKYMILTNGIAESTMGGRGIFELLNRPGVTIQELVTFETAQRRGAMLDVLSNQSGIPRNALEQARTAWISQAPQNFSSSVFRSGEVFSTRRQQRGDGVLQGLQPFLNHSVVSLSGRQNYIPVSYEAPQLVQSLSDLAVQNVRDYIRRNGGPSFTLDQIRQNLAERRTVQGVTFDYELGYFKSADCFNDAIGVIPKITVPRRESGGGGNDGPTTNPGEEPGDTGPSTSPGDESGSIGDGNDGSTGDTGGGASGESSGGAGVLG